jgi:hypothetical protein
MEIAALLAAVAGDEGLRDQVIASQDGALARLLARDFGGMLLGYVDRALDGPRRTAPVTFDFWDQVKQAETLEELRIYRPAAYEALPKEPGPEFPGPEPSPVPREPGPEPAGPEARSA